MPRDAKSFVYNRFQSLFKTCVLLTFHTPSIGFPRCEASKLEKYYRGGKQITFFQDESPRDQSSKYLSNHRRILEPPYKLSRPYQVKHLFINDSRRCFALRSEKKSPRRERLAKEVLTWIFMRDVFVSCLSWERRRAGGRRSRFSVDHSCSRRKVVESKRIRQTVKRHAFQIFIHYRANYY